MHLFLGSHTYGRGGVVSVFTTPANVPSPPTAMGFASTPVNPLPLTVKKYETGGNQISPSVVIIIIILAVVFFSIRMSPSPDQIFGKNTSERPRL